MYNEEIQQKALSMWAVSFLRGKEMIALLNVKQEAFCLHYAKTGNATESYKKAGYQCKNDAVVAAAAVRLLNQVKIKARLKELAEKMASEKIANIKEVQEFLTSVIRGETTDDVVVTEGCGDGVSEAKIVKVRTNNVARIKAATELAKMQGGYDNKLQVELTVPVFGGEERLED
jgi:phage terminase small subunit